MEKKVFVTAQEVADELGVSKGSAYKMIQAWNEKLKAQGYTTIQGRVSQKYFYEQFYGMVEKEGK